MSSDTVARVVALRRKAKELSLKGHLLRAAELFGRAASAAHDLGPDNLVALSMQRCQAGALLHYVSAATNTTTADASVIAAHSASFVAVSSATVAALERRRAAGTLLEGKCTAAEEAWHAGVLRDLQTPAASVATIAPLVGYELCLHAARDVLGMLQNVLFFADQCSATQLQSFAQFFVLALDLMPLPRRFDGILQAEVNLVEMLSTAIADASGVPDIQRRGLDARLVQQLTDAWQRLQRSSVLETRGIVEAIRRRGTSDRDAFDAVVDAAMSAPGLRSCALAGCGAKEAHPQHFKRCSACKGVVYCSKEHQLEDWPAHKAACKAARKAAAASSDAGAAGPNAA